VSEYVMVTCGRCAGTGTRDRDGRDPGCAVCEGKGQVFVRSPVVICGRCDGDGTRDRDGKDSVCSTCDGTGCTPLDDVRRYG